MSPYLFAFGPAPFVNSVIALSETEDLVYAVGVEFTDDDPTLYSVLLSRITEELNHVKDTEVLVLCPLLGDRFCTIALSIPDYQVFVISGVNVELLHSLKSQPGLIKISERQRPTNSSPSDATNHSSTPEKDQPNGDFLDLERLADRITVQARRGVVLLNSYLRDESDESNIDASILETDLSSLL